MKKQQRLSPIFCLEFLFTNVASFQDYNFIYKTKLLKVQKVVSKLKVTTFFKPLFLSIISFDMYISHFFPSLPILSTDKTQALYLLLTSKLILPLIVANEPILYIKTMSPSPQTTTNLEVIEFLQIQRSLIFVYEVQW